MYKSKDLILKILLLFSLVMPMGVMANDTTRVTVNPRLQHQTIEGWGASLCWWANMVGQWDDEEKIDQIVDLLTSPDKLNMNVFRYNIPGGDDPRHYSTPERPGHMAKGKGVRAEMEGFRDSKDSPYDWSRDAGQRKLLLKIKEKRPDAVFEAFSNSPPYWMTFSQCSSGHQIPEKDNLRPEYYEMFCEYLVEVCKHYKEEYGVEFKTLEPFNEPLTSYWHAYGSQEGCHFDTATQIEIIKRLYPKLKESGLATLISASDETDLQSGISALNAYLDDTEVLDMIGQFNVHSYSGTTEERLSLGNLVKTIRIPFWQSETGQFHGEGYVNNLVLAQKCFDDLRYMRPQAWLDWQVMEENNDTWCTIRGSFSEETFSPNKNFFVRMQITRFIKQGYIIIDTDQPNVLAALSPKNDELVVCVINSENRDNEMQINLSGLVAKGPRELYVTDSLKNCEKQDPLNIGEEGEVVLQSAGQSITTMVLPI